MDKSAILYSLNSVLQTTKITRENVDWALLQESIEKVVRKESELHKATRGQWHVIGLIYLSKLDEINEHEYKKGGSNG